MMEFYYIVTTCIGHSCYHLQGGKFKNTKRPLCKVYHHSYMNHKFSMYITPQNITTGNQFLLLLFYTLLFYHLTGILTKPMWFWLCSDPDTL